jgi:hypothetical protein
MIDVFTAIHIRHENKEENKSIPRNLEFKKMKWEVAVNVGSFKEFTNDNDKLY